MCESQKKRDRNRIAMGFLSGVAAVVAAAAAVATVATVATATATATATTVVSNSPHVRAGHTLWFRQQVRAGHTLWFENDARGELKNKRADAGDFPPPKVRKSGISGKKFQGNSIKKKHNLFFVKK